MGPLFLLVDDNPKVLRSAKRQLGKHRVVTASTPPEGSRVIRTWMWWSGMAIDLHLADGEAPNEPNQAGIPLVDLARERYPHVPIALNTGYDDPTLRGYAAARGAEYLLKGDRSARLFEFERRCSDTAPALPPLPPVVTSEAQLRSVLVHWVAQTIARFELSFPFGQLLFVEAEALAYNGRLLSRDEEAVRLGLTNTSTRNRRSGLSTAVRVHSLEEIFRRICYHAGLEHCFTDSPDRMRRISGTVPKPAHGQNPLAPRRLDEEGR